MIHREVHTSRALGQIATFAFVFGGSLIVHYLRNFKRDQEVKDTAVAHIGSAPQGTLAMQGFAWPLSPLLSPVSSQSCVYFCLVIEEERRRGNSSEWVKVYEEASTLPFACVDSTGYAVIFAQGAETSIEAKPVLFKALPQTQSLNLKTFLAARARSDVLRVGGLFSPPVRITEKVILTGSPFYLRGFFKTIAGLRPYPLLAASKVSQFINQARSTNLNPVFDLQRFDTNHDGKISGAEWRHGFASMAGAALNASAAAPLVTDSATVAEIYNHTAGVVTHDKENPLYFADCHQSEMLLRLENWNGVKLWAGALLIAVGFVLTLKFFSFKP